MKEIKVFTFLERSTSVWISLIALRLVLDISYVVFVHPVFEYGGFDLLVDPIKYIESWVYTLVIIKLLPKYLEKVSDYLIITMGYAFLFPILSYYSLSDQSREFLLLILMCSGVVYFFSKGKKIKIPSVKGGDTIVHMIIVSSILTITFWFIFTNGFQYFNLDLSSVYDYREDISSSAYIGFMAYLINWGTQVVGPLFIGLALFRKRYGLVFIGIAIHIIWFGFSSHKSVLFYPFLIIALWFWFEKYRSFAPLIFSVTVIVLISLLHWLHNDESLWATLFVRRTFFVVAKNTFDYYIFFSEAPKVLWSNSVLSSLIEYPYYVGPARLIGDWRGTGSHVNNSFISTGFMHAGVFGLLFYGLVVGVIFRLFDSLARNNSENLLVLSAILISSRNLILSADLPTALLTHGIGLGFVLAFLLKRRDACD
ncbi:MAG: hypothetical protein LAT53_04515 [Idiomarina sp.]|nr:hypothetical protein [Idiomarina sp.]